MAVASSVALCALLLLNDLPTDPAGDAPPPPVDSLPVEPVPVEAVPAEDPAKPLPDPGDVNGDTAEPHASGGPKAQKTQKAPLPDAPTASGSTIGIGTAAGGVLLGGLPAAACGWVPFVGVPIACFGTAVGAGAGGVIGTVLADGDLDGNVLLLGGAAGIAGAGALLGALAGTVLVLAANSAAMETGGIGYGFGAAVLGASALSFVGATAGSIGAGLLVASFPPPLREGARPRASDRSFEPEAGDEDDLLDALHHPDVRF